MSKIHQFKSYLTYWLDAQGKHSLQAPFIYELYCTAINPSRKWGLQPEIEYLRKHLSESTDAIQVKDYGSGSTIQKGAHRTVASIASHGITPKKYSALLVRLVAYLGATYVTELGTSLGINTLYLASNPNTVVTTVEGDPELASIAKNIFKEKGKENITLINNPIDKVLHKITARPVDFVYFDANHTYEATMHYFTHFLHHAHDSSCFVFDDIHYSQGMERAWEAIIRHPQITLSIDLHQMGIVFLKPEFIKQHYVLEF